MKQLFLIRHAKSSWADDSLSDRDRPLNARGQSQLASLGVALAHHGAFAGEIHASVATRAQATLAGVLPKTFPETRVHICPELYTFDHQKLLHWLQGAGDQETMAVIGHNPALLELAQWLLKQSPAQLPTGSFMQLRIPVDHWHQLGKAKGKGKLEALLTPQQFSYSHFARKQKKRANPDTTGRKRDLADTLQRLHHWLKDLEPGVQLGLDDEFLHQYRIALRRSRAIAESIREVSGSKLLTKPVKQLKQQAGATSQLRDLHVLLQQLPELCGGNEELETGLRTYFEQATDIEQQRLNKSLTSKHQHKRSQDWLNLIESGAFQKLSRSLSHKDIRTTVDRRMTQYNRKAAELTPESSDEEIHALRKLLKRTRYLMELEPDRWKGLLKRVKARQQLFGQFQDLAVQIQLLHQFRWDSPEALPAAVAGLETQLTQRKTDVREQILALGGLDGSPI
ncbi:CHAD domain-containing protein [Marinobacter similis]|uniref:Histidine phosphatase n=1 Tax=Marinobacter similis TaxID=1420916 RepID=W5YIA6_9GAMM|nr:CHAD domain-containing protein [Marinobacter similis]AHI28937.1 histidine phosphatase [Marinobacter similis]